MESSPLISAGLPIALFIIMIGIGMTLTIRDFRQVAVYPKGMIVGTIAQILVMPLIAFMLATLLAVPPAIAVGQRADADLRDGDRREIERQRQLHHRCRGAEHIDQHRQRGKIDIECERADGGYGNEQGKRGAALRQGRR